MSAADLFNGILAAHAAAQAAVAPKADTYRGWTITFDPPPIPVRNCDWQATGPDYDAWQDGDGWCDNGQKAFAGTREGLIAEIDAWFEENEA